jgi:hypothetical protein
LADSDERGTYRRDGSRVHRLAFKQRRQHQAVIAATIQGLGGVPLDGVDKHARRQREDLCAQPPLIAERCLGVCRAASGSLDVRPRKALRRCWQKHEWRGVGIIARKAPIGQLASGGSVHRQDCRA